MLLLILFIFLLLILLYIIFSATKNLDHWEKRGVKHVKPLPFIGNMMPLITNSESVATLVKNMYNQFPNKRYMGFFEFAKPILVIRDPDLIKSITIKNFEHFVDHSGFIATGTDPLWEKTLFASQGNRWRDLRQTLSPVFTSSKMRAMFVLMDDCAKQLAKYFKEQEESLIKVELKDVFTRFANDVIANTAFGIKCDSLKDPNNEFLLTGKILSDFTGLKRFKFFIYGSYPRLTKLLKLKMIATEVGNFYKNIIRETICVREMNKTVRPDLINLLMLSRQGKLKYEDYMNLPEAGFAVSQESDVGKTEKKNNYLTDEDITAQAVIFFMGGYETASSLIAFTGYELAVNPTIQRKLRQEIKEVYKKCGSSITYEKLTEMKYLDMIISESLRKWPPGVFLDRKCTRAFEIPPEKDGETPLKVNVGDVCWIPVYGLHMDPKYFPNPDVFDPERFNEENVEKMHSATYLPFGMGPRNCIGSRFALLECKIVLYQLLLEFEFVPTEKTQIPLKIRKDSSLLLPEKAFHLGLKRSPLP